MKQNLILLISALILISASIATGYKLGADANESKRDVEMKGYHKRYLDIYPFEGDITYDDFDYIFGRQDDEFYQMYTKSTYDSL